MLGVDVHRCRALHDVGDALEPHPAARIAAHRKTVQAEVEDFLHVRGRQHRHADRLENKVRLGGLRRGLRAMVIARKRNHATVLGGARAVRMAKDVSAAIHAGPLAVPDAEHAVVLRPREEVELLRAPERGCGEILVQPRLEADVVCLQMFFRAPQRLVIAAERRAAVAGDVPRRVQTGGDVAPALHDRQAHQRLGSGDENPATVQLVLVVERSLGEGGEIDRSIHRLISTKIVFIWRAPRAWPPLA